MKISTFKHENVLLDGSLNNAAGYVITNGCIKLSYPGDEVILLSVSMPVTESGTVDGFVIEFCTYIEFFEFLDSAGIHDAEQCINNEQIPFNELPKIEKLIKEDIAKHYIAWKQTKNNT